MQEGAPPGGDGLTWQTAERFLQDALYTATQNNEANTIKVATGTYYPDEADTNVPGVTPDGRESTFEIPNKTIVIGGYAGINYPIPDYRNPLTFPTVLSGDLEQNDPPGVPDVIGTNSLHVVTCIGAELATDTQLIGFTIRKGAARGDDETGTRGGGMRIRGSNVAVIDCVFEWNSASIDPLFQFPGLGGALSNKVVGAEPKKSFPFVVNCVFRENSANLGGAVYSVGLTEITIVNSLFIGNTASMVTDEWGRGGGIFSADRSMTLVNCTTVNNDAHEGGGIVYEGGFAGDEFIDNCIFWGNTDQVGGTAEEAQILNRNPLRTIIARNSCIEGLSEFADPPSSMNIGDDPQLEADFRLGDSSPCIEAGANAIAEAQPDDFDVNENMYLEEPTPDLDRCVRIRADIVDMGSYEFDPCPADMAGVAPTGPDPDPQPDGSVGFADLTLLLNAWGECAGPCCRADLNRDGSVGFADLTIVLNAWGNCPGQEAMAPVGGDPAAEPTLPSLAGGDTSVQAQVIGQVMDLTAAGELSADQCAYVLGWIVDHASLAPGGE